MTVTDEDLVAARHQLDQARHAAGEEQVAHDELIVRAIGEGLSPAHVARVLGVTPPAVSKALSRSRPADPLVLPDTPMGPPTALTLGRGRLGEHLSWDTDSHRHAHLAGPAGYGKTALARTIALDATRKQWTCTLIGPELTGVTGGGDLWQWPDEALAAEVDDLVTPVFKAAVATWPGPSARHHIDADPLSTSSTSRSSACRRLLIIDDWDRLATRLLRTPAGAAAAAHVDWICTVSGLHDVAVLTTGQRPALAAPRPDPTLTIALTGRKGQMSAGRAYMAPGLQ